MSRKPKKTAIPRKAVAENLVSKPLRFVINVLAWCEDSEWTAVALEMDLQGFGATRAAAEANLQGLILMQMELAVQKRDSRLMFRSAPPHLWSIFTREKERLMGRMIQGDDDDDAQYSVAAMPMDNKLLEMSRAGKPFARVHAS